MNRKLIVSILAIILVITMIFSLIIAIIPMSSAEGYESAQESYCDNAAICMNL